ncbi:MAG: hypothetical protein LUE89_06380 [Clostridiales bacterium]|nr:hypothetical protein [Clostridiales bacterium]
MENTNSYEEGADTLPSNENSSDFEGTLVAGDLSLIEGTAKIEDYSDIGMGRELYYSFVVKNNSGYTLTAINVHVLILDDAENILGTNDAWVYANIEDGISATISGSFTYDDYPNAAAIKVDSGMYDGNGDSLVFDIDYLDSEKENTKINLTALIPAGSR